MLLADLGDIFKKASKCVCTATVLVYPDTLSPIPSASSAMKTPDQQMKDISKWNTSLTSCTAQVQEK